MDTQPSVYVTVNGACVEVAFQRTEPDRLGVWYLFRVKDFAKDRGERLVGVVRTGPDQMYRDVPMELDDFAINTIRRALDDGRLDFNAPFEADRYLELKFSRSDLEQSEKAIADKQITEFIEHVAYWLGYRYNPNPAALFPVSVTRPIDLKYLGVGADHVQRILWRLSEKNLIQKTAMPGLILPSGSFIEAYEAALQTKCSPGHDDARGESVSSPLASPTAEPSSRLVFVVHGHELGLKESVARFLEKLDLKPIILHEQANRGRTVIEKFEEHSDVAFAVVLLTPDDTGGSRQGGQSPRARQNVILELGYFIGKLGRSRVCALHVGGVELPSDIHGVLYLPADATEKWKIDLAREISAAGITVDLNRAL